LARVRAQALPSGRFEGGKEGGEEALKATTRSRPRVGNVWSTFEGAPFFEGKKGKDRDGS